MSETPPSEGEFGRGAPVPPTQTANGGMPRQYHAPGEPLPPKPKRKLAWGWFSVGLATPFAVFALSLYLASLGGSSDMFGPLVNFLFSLNVAVFIGALVAAAVGRDQNRNGLRSFGVGGLVAYAIVALLGLLAFGACFVSFAGIGR